MDLGYLTEVIFTEPWEPTFTCFKLINLVFNLLSHLSTKGNYTKYISGLVRQARPIQGSDLVLKAKNIKADVRIQYKDQAEFERIAGEFGIFEEWKVNFRF